MTVVGHLRAGLLVLERLQFHGSDAHGVSGAGFEGGNSELGQLECLQGRWLLAMPATFELWRGAGWLVG